MAKHLLKFKVFQICAYFFFLINQFCDFSLNESFETISATRSVTQQETLVADISLPISFHSAQGVKVSTTSVTLSGVHTAVSYSGVSRT